ncbi:MAG TPA: TcpE family conjugal transfer membrane protein [Streptosporangiaceae bacterium]|nr:TcpE family conjugal transfer membrane protein [Streptosporangiaceae bacterium]
MDLPTYTNIWRIEKRLYKLYDFRLPMPLPVGQIAVFTAIAVPYVVILKVLGLPFSHTLLWLYVLPPGALAWVVTRPVLESKRLPELVVSQLRYLSEPRTWCRMAPLAEKDEIVIAARVWRRVAAVPVPDRPQAPVPPGRQAPVGQPEGGAGRMGRRAGARGRPGNAVAPAWPHQPARGVRPPAVPEAPAHDLPTPAVPVPLPGRAVPVSPARDVPVLGPAAPAARAPDGRGVPAPDRADREVPGSPAADVMAPHQAARAATAPDLAAAAAPQASPERPRPVVTVTGDQDGERPLRMVERALGSPSERRGSGWHDHVVVVPGGHRPGRPDQLQRDRARSRLPVRGRHRVVVLGCTVGAGQTMTTLLTGELLASLRGDPVAVLDLNPGEGSLAVRARAVPALAGSRPPAPSRAEVITREAAGPEGDPHDVTRVFELISERYPLTLADPGAAAVPRVLMAAQQLVLVAPASQDAASALATTREWLEAHGHAELADGAIVVLNGVSRHTLPHVEQAEALARGRCRAIVRIPWDDHLKDPGPERGTSPALPARPAPAASPGPAPQRDRVAAGSLSPAALRAFTALSGVLIAALAAAPERLQQVRR